MEAGAARVIPDDECDAHRVLAELSALIDDPAAWRAMAEASRRLGRPRRGGAGGRRLLSRLATACGENPTVTRHVHFLGICGYAVSGAALVAREQGWRVSGSDDQAYPPTTDILTAAGVDWVDGSDPANLERWGVPDLVVVGNQTRVTNPEWLAARDRGLPTCSEIEFYLRLTGDRVAHRRLRDAREDDDVVAARPHARRLRDGSRASGWARPRSTSAAARASAAGRSSSRATSTPPRRGTRGPSSSTSTPQAACVTRLELDHPDVYPTLDAYRAPFVELARSMPADGLLVLCADDPECVALAAHASCRVTTYGCAPGADWRVALGADTRRRAALHHHATAREVHPVALTFPGAHNALNATAALLLARRGGRAAAAVHRGVRHLPRPGAPFRGARRRRRGHRGRRLRAPPHRGAR